MKHGIVEQTWATALPDKFFIVSDFVSPKTDLHLSNLQRSQQQEE